MKLVTFGEYIDLARKTANYPEAFTGSPKAFEYVGWGLCGETGEAMDAAKKILREPERTDELEDKVLKELGDVLWYLAAHVWEFKAKAMIGAVVGDLRFDALVPIRFTEKLPSARHLMNANLNLLEVASGSWGLSSVQMQVCSTFRAWVGLCLAFNFDPAFVATNNINKLDDRLTRGVINGSGDDR